MKKSTELAHVRQLCSLGLGGAAIMPALLRSARQIVPSDSAGFFWVDAQGELTNMFAERLLPPALMQRYFERYYDGAEHSFPRRVRERMARREYVGAVDADGALERTPYYQEILRPLGVHRVLFAVVHDGDLPLGQVSLYRGRDAAPFTTAEAESLGSVARYLAQALSVEPGALSALPPYQFRDGDEDALIVCNAAGEIALASYRSYALLAHASGEALNRTTMTGPSGGALARAGRGLLAGLVSKLGANVPTDRSSQAVVAGNAWGRFRLRAYALGEDCFGVLIQRHEHLLVRLLDAMRTLPLSPQQRQAALLLAQNKSDAEVAAATGVTANTARYHIKQLFAKLGAHDRAEVIARILAGHTERY